MFYIITAIGIAAALIFALRTSLKVDRFCDDE